MRFETDDGQALDLHVVGYQYPQLETELYDSNWLIVEVNLFHHQGAWSIRDPCLLTYEAVELGYWLEEVARWNPPRDSCAFVEQNLWFEYIEYSRAEYLEDTPNSDGGNLTVHLDGELCPVWARSTTTRRPGRTFQIQFPQSEENLREAAKQWRDEIAKFPQRAER